MRAANDVRGARLVFVPAILLLLVGAPARSQEGFGGGPEAAVKPPPDQPLITDRPDFTESTDAVPPGGVTKKGVHPVGARSTALYVGVANTSCINALVGLAPAQSTEAPEKPVDGIRDNSFLIEEAYNQEAGVVQHIWTAQFGADHRGEPSTRSSDLSFTQEWPVFGQTHQLSYTVPYAFLDEDGEHENGGGDVLLNYRYQLFEDEGAFPAFAPRFSVIFPSGDEDRGFGNGRAGVQLTLPLSKTLSDRVYVNFNAGLTYIPDATIHLSDGDRSSELDLLSFNLGGSVIYAVTDELNLLLEVRWNSDEGLQEKEKTRRGKQHFFADRNRSDEVVISPGLRWAINLPGQLQIVPGLAFPIGLSDDAIDYGVFFYFSVEHPFLPAGN